MTMPPKKCAALAADNSRNAGHENGPAIGNDATTREPQRAK
jgi:hypothetical protein